MYNFSAREAWQNTHNLSSLGLNHLTEILTPLKKTFLFFFDQGIIIIAHVAMVLNTAAITGTPSLWYLKEVLTASLEKGVLKHEARDRRAT